MKKNSIVVILPLKKFLEEHPYRENISWLPVDDEKETYMVRDILPNDCVLLEENSLGQTPLGFEIGISVKYVREILPDIAVDIQNLMEEPYAHS